MSKTEKDSSREKFAGKDESIVNTALMAFQAGYAYPVGNVLTHHYQFEHIPKTSGRAQITMDGNQALAYGLIAAGVRYGAGYPITPWSSIMEILRRELRNTAEFLCRPRTSSARCRLRSAFRIPDISRSPAAPDRAFRSKPKRSVGRQWRRSRSSFATFNAAARARACRPTLSKAICIRRSSAATATARASCSRQRAVEDCFYIAIEAARIARKYSTPVFILSDTSLATRIEAFDEPDLSKLMVDPKPDLTPREGGFKPYRS